MKKITLIISKIYPHRKKSKKVKAKIKEKKIKKFNE
jgi:hypothetical protein